MTTGVAPALISDFEQHQPLAAGDFDLDGNLDLAVAQASSNSVVVLFGTGRGSFSPTSLSIATDLGPVAVTAGKLDRDHKLDLVVANALTDKVTVVLNRPAAHR